MSYSNDGNYKDGGFDIEYIQYIVAEDLDFGPKDQARYEDDYDGDVPQVTYMPYVFLMQETYAKRQEEEEKKAKAFSAVFIPMDKFIMEYLNNKQNGNKFIEDGDKAEISKLKEFAKLNSDFQSVTKRSFFENISGNNLVSSKSNQIMPKYSNHDMQKPYLNRPSSMVMNPLDSPALTAGGGRRSHKPSHKKTGKGKSRSRSRSRSKTRSKSKSKSRAKSKSKRR